MDVVKKPFMVAVSGVKNSGKTTFLEMLVKDLTDRGYQIAVIKHDGHEFEPDVKGTDTWRLRQSGAYGTAIFSKKQWMMTKQQYEMNEEKIAAFFSEADIIFLEGFKYSRYPKFEIVRKANSSESVCRAETLLALITDMEVHIPGVPVLGFEDWDKAADIVELNCKYFKASV